MVIQSHHNNLGLVMAKKIDTKDAAKEWFFLYERGKKVGRDELREENEALRRENEQVKKSRDFWKSRASLLSFGWVNKYGESNGDILFNTWNENESKWYQKEYSECYREKERGE